MARRTSEEEINIFNFSFLDILSCTIGSLVFILLLIVLSTQDMVEKKFLEELREKFATTKTELADLEENISARRKELWTIKDEFEKIQAEKTKLEGKVDVLAKEKADLGKKTTELATQIGERDKRIGKLKEQLTQKEEKVPGLNSIQASSDGKSWQSQESIWNEPLFSNYERKVITCAKEKIYLGNSRIPVKISDKKKFEDAIKQFMRYYNEKTEHLWWIRQNDSKKSYEAATQAVQALRSSWGEGLKPAREKKLPAFSNGKNGKLKIDRNGDGSIDVKYGYWDEKGKWEYKHVQESSASSIYEERYQEYDRSTHTWKEKCVDTDGDDNFDLRLFDIDPTDDDWEEIWVFLGNVNSLAENQCLAKYKDNDNDGVYDKKWIERDPKNKYYEHRYDSYNQLHKRWGFLYDDLDSDGKWEVAWVDRDMSDDAWEEKWAKTDKDGNFDLKLVDIDDSDCDWEKLYSKPHRAGEGNIQWGECIEDSNGDGKWNKKFCDFDYDDIYDVLLEDSNDDGKWDVKWGGGDKKNWGWKLVDTNSDGQWDKQWVDKNMDGEWDDEFVWNASKKKFVRLK